MAARHPDRIPFAAYAGAARTIADMQRLGWLIRRRCQRCGHRLRTPYPVLLRLFGPTAELWDRRPACPLESCGGRMLYEGRPRQVTVYRPLTSAERYRDDGL